MTDSQLGTCSCIGLISILIALPVCLVADLSAEIEMQPLSKGNNHSGFIKEQVSSTKGISGMPVLGTLQIPYSGLTTRSLTPSFAEHLGLNDTIRGALITDIIPGSPAESIGLRPMNLSKRGADDQIIASRGDIIQAVDGSASFITEYNGIEQYSIANKRVGENITLRILRDNYVKDAELTLRPKPMFIWYENADEGIRIKYPSDWIVVEEMGQSRELIVQFQSPETSSSVNLPVVEASVSKFDSTFNESSRSLNSKNEKEVKVFRMLNFDVLRIGNSPSYSAVFYDYTQNNNTRKVMTVFIESGSELYSLNFSLDPFKYDDYLQSIREMIRSFRFSGM